MVDIFDEVSGDLRAEQGLRLLRRYGLAVLAACLLVVLGVAASEAYGWVQTRQDARAAARYLQITGPVDAAGPGLTNAQALADGKQLADFAAGAPAGYRSLARLRAAGLYAQAGQVAAAEGLWNQVAADGDADRLLRDFAKLAWAQHALGSAPDDAVAARLAVLTGLDNPWHGLARETQALMFLHEGKISEAKAIFAQISADPDAPDGVRNRADGLLAKLNG